MITLTIKGLSPTCYGYTSPPKPIADDYEASLQKHGYSLTNLHPSDIPNTAVNVAKEAVARYLLALSGNPIDKNKNYGGSLSQVRDNQLHKFKLISPVEKHLGNVNAMNFRLCEVTPSKENPEDYIVTISDSATIQRFTLDQSI